MSRLISELEEPRFRHGPRHSEPGTRRHARALFLLLTLTALAAVVVGLLPATGTTRVYLLGVVGLGGFLAVGKALARFGRLERATRRRRQNPGASESLPPFFERVQRRLELASASLGQYEQLRPQLRAIAEQRLAARGLRFESEQAQELLGSREWRLLARAPEGDKFAPGPETAELGRLIEALERI